MARTAYVLDIGTTKTACIAATKEGDDVRIVSAAAVGTRGVKKGRIADPDQLGECIKIAVSRLREDTGAVASRLIVSVPGHLVVSEQSRGMRQMFPAGKQVHQEDLLLVNEHSLQIRFKEGYELLQTLACEYRIDGEPVLGNPLERPATRLEVVTHVMSGKKEDVDRVRRIVQVASAEVEQFVPTALASGLGTVHPDDAERGCVVVDIGGGTTDAALFERGACTRIVSIEANGGHITADLAALIKISLEDAEALKIAHGHADPEQVRDEEMVEVKQVESDQVRKFPRKVLSEIIESRVREIATLVRDELLLGNKHGALPKTVLLTGGGSQLAGVDSVFKRVFEAENCRATSPRLVAGSTRRAAVPEMAGAVGLALFALGAETEDLEPVAGNVGWKDKMKSLKSIFSARS